MPAQPGHLVMRGARRSLCAGTSVYGFNPQTGRICRHIDTWDSIDNQQFFR